VRWLRSKLSDHPLATFVQPVHLTSPAALALPRTYIYCTEKDGQDIFAPFARRLRSETGWRYCEVHSGHEAMITAPQELATVLLALV